MVPRLTGPQGEKDHQGRPGGQCQGKGGFRQANAAAEARVVKAQAEAKALRLVGEALEGREDLLTFRYIEKLAPNIKAMLTRSCRRRSG